MMGPSDVVYVEKRTGPRTDPWGTPVTNWCALDASPPQATLKDRPVSGREDLMIDSVKSGRQIQQNEDWWFGIGFCNSQGFSESSAVSVEWPLLKPDCLASSLLFCEKNNETWLKTTRSSVLTMNGRRANCKIKTRQSRLLLVWNKVSASK